MLTTILKAAQLEGIWLYTHNDSTLLCMLWFALMYMLQQNPYRRGTAELSYHCLM